MGNVQSLIDELEEQNSSELQKKQITTRKEPLKQAEQSTHQSMSEVSKSIAYSAKPTESPQAQENNSMDEQLKETMNTLREIYEDNKEIKQELISLRASQAEQKVEVEEQLESAFSRLTAEEIRQALQILGECASDLNRGLIEDHLEQYKDKEGKKAKFIEDPASYIGIKYTVREVLHVMKMMMNEKDDILHTVRRNLIKFQQDLGRVQAILGGRL